MAAGNACNTYLNSHYDGMDPKQLILMLYDGAIKFNRLAKEGFNEKNIQKRGENIGKVIAIISELNSSLDPTVQDDSIDFLRNLYATMLTELPKASLNNDIKILDLTESYLFRLREIWVNNVMNKSNAKPAVNPKAKAPIKQSPSVQKPIAVKNIPTSNSYNKNSNYSGSKSSNYSSNQPAPTIRRKSISA